jgi:hypothetical protein
MRIIRTLSMCAVSFAGFALLAVPVQPVGHAQSNQSAVAFSTEASNTSHSAAACILPGRPCNPKASTCCAGLRCVFHGGSTRVGYMCLSRSAAISSPWELSENNLDRRPLTELLR